jgi:hypothetical protein
MYNIDNFNTSFNRQLRALIVKKKTHFFSYRAIRTEYSIYGLKVEIVSRYQDHKVLTSHFTFAIDSNIKNENIHSLSNRHIANFAQLEKNRRPIGSDPLVNRFSETQLEQFHSVALIASQHLVLTTIESYIDALFDEVSIELLNRQFATTTGGNN